MRNYIRISLLFLVLVLASCEDVIDVEVQSAQTRLVIEASIDWEKGTRGNSQRINLRNSTDYFDTTSLTDVTGASVSITNDTSGEVFVFEDQNTGAYTTDSFVPVLGQSYTLEVINEGETYIAQETLQAVTDVIDVYQAREDGFDDELLEVHIVFVDPPEEGDSYLFKYTKQDVAFPEFETWDDEFTNGNELDLFYEWDEDEDTDEIEAFEPGDTIVIDMYGISVAYLDYMDILLEQNEGAGLFSTTPVALRGNCTNPTNPDNHAHGYFRLTEFNKITYTFE